MKTFTIGWLNKCRCGNKSHSVKTARGNESALWDDDAVKCNSCGRGGVIQVYEGQARVLWETDEEMAENKPMSTITKEFTKEQLIARINQVTAINKYRIGRDPSADGLAMDNELFAIALASLEAEPVGTFRKGPCGYSPSFHEDAVPLYTAPPVPVSVPAEVGWEDVPEDITEDDMEVALAWAHGFNQCRAAMLQSFGNSEQLEPVTTTYKLSDAVEALRNSGIAIDAEKIQEERDALNSPVIPDGWVMVPVEPTAEMISSGIAAHYERSQIQIHDRPAPGPMECAYVAMLAAAPTHACTNDGWVACSERMPSTGEPVLAYRPDAPESNDPLIKMATYAGKSVHGHGFDCYCKPTHWMPLPAAPQQEAE